jgi:hypothetical protein
MKEGLWEDYDSEEEDEPYERGRITSKLELSDSDLWEVKEVLGASPDEVFDRFEGRDLEGSGYEADAAAKPKGGEMVLQGDRDISTEALAHESVHGAMMQPDASNNLFGDNQFENTLYDEFVARMAEAEIKELQVPERAIEDLRDAHSEYLQTREKYAGDVFSEEFDSLYEDVMALERTDDKEVNQEMDAVWRPYQDLREQVLAAKAAEEYKEENEVEIQEFIKPDTKLYEKTVEYIRQTEARIYD